MRERRFPRLGVLMAAATFILCGVCLPAMAQEGYIGASYLDTSGEFFASGENFDADDSGWKIFGGYNFSKFFGLELTYYDLGTFEDTQGADTFSADISAYDLALRGILPIGERFELSARLGYSNVSVDATLVAPLTTTTVDASDWELVYGLGAAVKLGTSFGVRLEWESWDVAEDVQAYSLGLYYRFGQR